MSRPDNSVRPIDPAQHLKNIVDTVMGPEAKGYEPKDIEATVTELWENGNYFEPSGEGRSYCIMQPPPNVTGSLHMGHGLQTALMDALIRYHRMQGFNTLWQPGIDHAGIATQLVVTNRLTQRGIDPKSLTREQFLDKIWEWKGESGGTIQSQFHRLGASADWDRSRFTMDDDYYQAVITAFVKLYDEGLIYKGPRLVNWDPVIGTALSDLEVTAEEENGSLWYLRYPLSNDPTQHLLLATTRPETMFGDTAVAVNPTDERYQHLIGKTVILPIVNKEIPIIADDMVDPAFGTGVVKITPAHDINDFATGKRHNLPAINILTPEARLNENVPAEYQGLDRFEARQKVIDDLKNRNQLDRIEPHKLKIPRGERSKAVIEPRLTEQWFVKTEALAQEAIDVVKRGDINFVPENWKNTYFHWMENIEEWCISRQLVWGHRVPAWYDAKGTIYVGIDEKGIREKYKLSEDITLRQDDDVLDTWFSSALWPMGTLGWPNSAPDLSTFYPTNVLVTGHDIIFFWVARMIMFGMKFMEKPPFTEVYVTGLIYDQFGKKMSKSQGNVIDPIDLIDGIGLEKLVEKRTSGLMLPGQAEKIREKTRKEFPKGIPAFGTDALRFAFNISSIPGYSVNFNVKEVEVAKHFCNKIWNAAKYIFQQVENQSEKTIISDQKIIQYDLPLFNRWILSKLQRLISNSHENYAKYRLDILAHDFVDFAWKDFCDWYLEISKFILRNPEETESNKRLTIWTLITTLETLLRLLHPMMPFITEALWQSIKSIKHIAGDSIMQQAYPVANEKFVDIESEHEVDWIKNVITAIRSLRGIALLQPGVQVPILLKNGTEEDKRLLRKHSLLIQKLTKSSSINWLRANESTPAATTSILGQLEIYIPVLTSLDTQTKEKERLQKQIEGLLSRIEKSKKLLNNPQVLANAKGDYVSNERAKLTQIESEYEKLSQQLRILSLNATDQTQECSIAEEADSFTTSLSANPFATFGSSVGKAVSATNDSDKDSEEEEAQEEYSASA